MESNNHLNKASTLNSKVFIPYLIKPRMKDYFAVLGFNIEKSDELLVSDWDGKLKDRYREICSIIHPDMNIDFPPPEDIDPEEFGPEGFTQEGLSVCLSDCMKEVNEAYEILSDKTRRDTYLTQIRMLRCKGRLEFEESQMTIVMADALKEIAERDKYKALVLYRDG